MQAVPEKNIFLREGRTSSHWIFYWDTCYTYICNCSTRNTDDVDNDWKMKIVFNYVNQFMFNLHRYDEVGWCFDKCSCMTLRDLSVIQEIRVQIDRSRSQFQDQTSKDSCHCLVIVVERSCLHVPTIHWAYVLTQVFQGWDHDLCPMVVCLFHSH